MSFVVLAVGTVVVLSFFAFAGRLIGFSVMGLWSAGTAYFFMAPVYSFRVSNSRDLAALALYGTVGLVLARTTPGSRRRERTPFQIRYGGFYVYHGSYRCLRSARDPAAQQIPAYLRLSI